MVVQCELHPVLLSMDDSTGIIEIPPGEAAFVMSRDKDGTVRVLADGVYSTFVQPEKRRNGARCDGDR